MSIPFVPLGPLPPDGDGGVVVVNHGISVPIIIGDNYLMSNGRAFQFNVLLPGNVTAASLAYFEGRHRYRPDMFWRVRAELSFPVTGEVRITAELVGSDTADLLDGEYLVSASIVDDSGNLITPVASLDVPVNMIYGAGSTRADDCSRT